MVVTDEFLAEESSYEESVFEEDLLNSTLRELRDCQDLLRAGYSDSDVYVVNDAAAASRLSTFEDRRLCDQETSGGGWTVNRASAVFSLVTVFMCCMMK